MTIVDRRQAGSGQARRRGRSASGGAQSPIGFLGTNLIDIWDSRDAVESDTGEADEGVDSWTGRKLGLVVVAELPSLRPTLNAIDADFAGNPTVQTANTNQHALRSAGDHASDIIATGTRPYMAIYAALADQTGTAGLAFSIAAAGGIVSKLDLARSTAEVTFVERDNAATAASVADPGVAPHLFEWWIDAAAGVVLAIDGVTVDADATATAAIDAAVRRIGIGMYTNGNLAVNARFALGLLCTAAPTAGERATLLNYCTQLYT